MNEQTDGGRREAHSEEGRDIRSRVERALVRRITKIDRSRFSPVLDGGGRGLSQRRKHNRRNKSGETGQEVHDEYAPLDPGFALLQCPLNGTHNFGRKLSSSYTIPSEVIHLDRRSYA